MKYRFPSWSITALLSLGLWSAALLGPLGCVATPVPEPPDLDPLDPPVTDLLLGNSVPTTLLPAVELRGQPGAAEPGAILWTVDLESTAAPAETTVEADGSFHLSLNTAGGGEVRLQLRTGDGRRSSPVDLLLPSSLEPVRPEVVTRQACVTVTPPLELDFGEVPVGGATGSIALENNCGAQLRLDRLELRAPMPAFQPLDTPPLVVPAGETRTLEVRFQPQSDRLTEEILFIGAELPFVERWPVTLVGRSRTN